MIAIRFMWIDDGQLNQVICHAFDDIVDFVSQNNERTYTVDIWRDP